MKDDIRIHVMHTGKVYIDEALAFREKGWHPMPYTGWFRGKKKKRWVPVSTYLIEHPRGNVLVDAGWHTDIRHRQRKHLGLIPYTMFRGTLPAGEAVHEQLQTRGLRPGDLDVVVLTHLHADHVSGIRHVEGARNILVSAEEWKAAHKDAGYVRSMWEGVPIHTFEWQRIPFGPYQKGLDLFGDESLYLVFTPGHSRGQVSVLVRQGTGWVLLASDVGYAEKSWKEMILPGVTASEEQAEKSLAWIRAFSQRSDCYATLANHDPDVVPGEWIRPDRDANVS